jgi:hypothetical protein
VIASGIFFWKLASLRPLLRPIYIRKGIIPQMATAIQQTSAME